MMIMRFSKEVCTVGLMTYVQPRTRICYIASSPLTPLLSPCTTHSAILLWE